MKRMLATVLVGAMCLSCVGCSTDTADTADTQVEDVASTSTATTVVKDSLVAQTLSTTGVSANFSADDQFSNKDYEVGCISDSYITITLADGGSSADDSSVTIEGNVITITQEGSYAISGTLTNGQIVVDTDDTAKVQLSLNGVSISNDTTAPIYGLEADKIFITTEYGTTNTLVATLVEDETADTNVDAVIFAKTDLTLNGEGTLVIEGINGNAITSKDDLVVTSGSYDITVDGHGLEANNSIRIAGGTFDITSQKDGLHCEHDEDATLGYIYIVGGTYTIDAQGDGLDSSSYLEIEAGDFDITVGGGIVNAVESTTSTMGGMSQMGGRTEMGTATQDTMELPEMGEMPTLEEGTMPGADSGMMGGRGTMGTMEGTEGTELPEMGEIPTLEEGTMGTMPGGMGSAPGMTGGQSAMPGMGTIEGTEGTELPEMTEREMPTMEEGTLEEGTMGTAPGMMGGQSGMMGGQGTMGQVDSEFSVETEEDDSLSTKAMKATLEISIYDGTFVVDGCDDAFHSNGAMEIFGGTFEVQTGDDAFRAETTMEVSGGTINITSCYEGLEGHTVTVSGGDIYIYANDDGINAVKSSYVDSAVEVAIYITGGNLVIDANDEGDGFDSNSNIYMTGGSVLISGTPTTTDTSLDYGGTATITGGTFFATGSTSQTRQNFGEESTQGSIMVDLSSSQTGSVTLTDSSGNVVVTFDPVKAYQTVHISSADIVAGETYTLTCGDETQTIEMESLLYGYNADTGPGGMSQMGGMSQGGMSQMGGMSGGMGGMSGGMGGR